MRSVLFIALLAAVTACTDSPTIVVPYDSGPDTTDGDVSVESDAEDADPGDTVADDVLLTDTDDVGAGDTTDDATPGDIADDVPGDTTGDTAEDADAAGDDAEPTDADATGSDASDADAADSDTQTDAADADASDVPHADVAEVDVTDTTEDAADASDADASDADVVDADAPDGDADAADATVERCVVPFVPEAPTSDGTPSDLDGDGVPNTLDNCPDAWNPNQVDLDADGVGAACDDAVWGALEDGALMVEIDALVTATYAPPAPLYQDARAHMFTAIDLHGGVVECVYTGWTWTSDGGEPNHTIMNTEHTWPQSLGAGEEPERADLHHLFPTQSDANNRRSSYPFCNVVSGVTWSQGGSRLGRDASGTQCFEPRASHRGNVARAMLYFAAVYDPTLDPAQEEVLRCWSALDPVDAAERARNDAIEAWMGSRNPFVDRPDLANRIADF